MNGRNAGTQARKGGFGTLLAGPVTWMLFFLSAYGVTGIGCELLPAQSVAGEFSILRGLVAGLAVIAIAVAVFAGVRAAMHLRKPRSGPNAIATRRRFAEMAGVGLCAASVVGITWLTIGVLVHPLC